MCDGGLLALAGLAREPVVGEDVDGTVELTVDDVVREGQQVLALEDDAAPV